MTTPLGQAFAAMLDTQQQLDPVPCAGCTQCCRHNQSVELRPEWGDDPREYPHKWVENLGDHYGQVLARKPDGSCIHLGETGCTIYDKRPVVCRGFDCRRNALCFDAAQRSEAIARRIMPAEIFAAGDERMASLRVLPGEEASLGYGVGTHVLERTRRRT